MKNPTQQIAEALAGFFAEQDRAAEKSQIDWALNQAAILREFRASAEYQDLRKKGAWALYEKLHAIAGGKTWYQVLTQSEESIRAHCVKVSKAAQEKRDSTIAAKLNKEGVTTIAKADVALCAGGFTGVFIIDDDRIVTIQSILAGGHTVQCLHQRVLVKVSKAKK